jgi:plasmid stability protein
MTITISNLDDGTIAQLQHAAARHGMSVEAFAADVLRQSVGGKLASPPAEQHPTIQSLAGTWSEEEFREFTTAIAPFEQIDDSLWK